MVTPRLPASIVRLIPLLGSPVDGEVLATVRAMSRALKGAGADWHDVARVIGESCQPSPSVETRAPPHGSTSGWKQPARPEAAARGWPTWSRLKGTPAAIAWLDLVLQVSFCTPAERRRLSQVRELVAVSGAPIGPDNVALVNRLLRQAWQAGLRVEPKGGRDGRR